MTMSKILQIFKQNGVTFFYVFILALGILMRIVQFPYNPAGSNQDELQTALEVRSILQTGSDRWGYFWPPLFLSWGSGQNALYNYIMLPFAAIFGDSMAILRLPALLCGCLSLPLIYQTMKNLTNKPVFALATMGFLAVSPWHIIMSKWGLEAFLLPFFYLLLLYVFSVLVNFENKYSYLFLGMVFVLPMYAYGVGIFVAPLFTLFAVLICIKYFWKNKKLSIFSLITGAILIWPLVLVMFKNFVSKKDFWFEQYLPFDLPLLGTTRLSQIAGGSGEGNKYILTFNENWKFIQTGFADGMPWQTVNIKWPPLPEYLWAFILLGVVYLVLSLIFNGESKSRSNALLVLAFALACIPYLFIAPLNTVRANVFLMPLLLLAGFGFGFIYKILSRIKIQFLFVIVVIFVIGTFTTSFSRFFYGPGYEDTMQYVFNYGFEQSLNEAIAVADKDGISKIVVTKDIQLPDVYTLYHSNYRMDKFKENRFPKNPLPDTTVEGFGRFSFYPNLNEIKNGEKYVYVGRMGYFICSTPKMLINVKNWKAEICDDIVPIVKPK
jgi:4-amino-4-deoxy-L-arabinose transferase-like glycosyltransferase